MSFGASMRCWSCWPTESSLNRGVAMLINWCFTGVMCDILQLMIWSRTVSLWRHRASDCYCFPDFSFSCSYDEWPRGELVYWMKTEPLSRGWKERDINHLLLPQFQSSSASQPSASSSSSSSFQFSLPKKTASFSSFTTTVTNFHRHLFTLTPLLQFNMQFSTIIASLSLALMATAAPANTIEARTGGHSGGHPGGNPGSQPAGSCTSSQYSHPTCCNGVTGSSNSLVSISVIRDISGQLECLLGGSIIGNVCGQESNNLCCDQDVSNSQVRRKTLCPLPYALKGGELNPTNSQKRILDLLVDFLMYQSGVVNVNVPIQAQCIVVWNPSAGGVSPRLSNAISFFRVELMGHARFSWNNHDTGFSVRIGIYLFFTLSHTGHLSGFFFQSDFSFQLQFRFRFRLWIFFFP